MKKLDILIDIIDMLLFGIKDRITCHDVYPLFFDEYSYRIEYQFYFWELDDAYEDLNQLLRLISYRFNVSLPGVTILDWISDEEVMLKIYI